MLVKAVLLALVATVALAQFPCDTDAECQPPTKCDLSISQCYTPGGNVAPPAPPTGSNCTDSFSGKGSCELFKNKGYCDTGNKNDIKKYCAKTCNAC
uniref:ShKT domain-containing protein n=1 Tax=Steinernema glaseri TaxID=37863 RepID=A0A1I8AAG4_9BILA